jgi:hypothetical protein
MTEPRKLPSQARVFFAGALVAILLATCAQLLKQRANLKPPVKSILPPASIEEGLCNWLSDQGGWVR